MNKVTTMTETENKTTDNKYVETKRNKTKQITRRICVDTTTESKILENMLAMMMVTLKLIAYNASYETITLMMMAMIMIMMAKITLITMIAMETANKIIEKFLRLKDVIIKRSRVKIPNKPGGYSTTNIKRMMYEHKQIQKWNGKIKKCLSKDLSDDIHGN